MLGPSTTASSDILAAHFLLRHLRREELEQLASHARIVKHPAGVMLFQKGDPGDSMIVVVSGRVRICTLSPEGRELVLNIINPGEVFGEMALLDGQPRSADAVTIEPCELLSLRRQDFLPFIERHPMVCVRLLELLSLKLRRTSEWLEETVFLGLPPRLARRLLWLAEVFGREDENGVRIDIALSQQQLGSLLGMTRESMNKQLGLWRRAGVITVDNGYLTIRDMTTLQEIAEGE